MPQMNLAIDHALSRDEARQRLQRLIEVVKDAYGGQVKNLQENWTEHAVEFSFSAMGFSTSGKVQVEETHVAIESKLPLAAVMFRGKIEETIRHQVGRALS